MSRRAALDIPDAWPALMTREQACAYLGVCAATFAKICPVSPLDLGANVLRWPRAGIDAWISTVPPRLPGANKTGHHQPAPTIEPTSDEEEWAASLRRSRARAEGRSCRKSATSSASR